MPSPTTREQILAALDLDREAISLPEWGFPDGLYIRVLTGDEREEFEAVCQAANQDGPPKSSHFRATLTALCLVDEAGESVFTRQDIPAIGAKAAPVLKRIWDAAIRLNGIESTAEQEAAAEKN